MAKQRLKDQRHEFILLYTVKSE